MQLDFPLHVQGMCALLLGAVTFSPSCASTHELDAERTLGSLTNSVVALEIESASTPLVFVAGSLSDDDVANLKQVAPNLDVRLASSREQALQWAPEAHGVDARYFTAEFRAAAPDLAWVQASSAGVDRYLAMDELREADDLVFTNMQGAHGPTIADHVFALLLGLTRDLRYQLQDSRRGEWNRRGSGEIEPVALEGRTLLVVGLGGIGREVAKRGKGFGMTVWATKRTPTTPPSYVDRQETSDQFSALLPGADVVVLCVPLTDQTRGMLDAQAFASMKKGSFLINIARGPVVDTDALMVALQDGTLAGAGLDVTDPEPLPADHPLWQLPNVNITPHMAGRSALTSEDWTSLYVENLRRFAHGEPLLNVVDKQAGY